MRAHRFWPDRAVAAAVLALTTTGLVACAAEDDGNPLAPELEAQVPDIRGSEDLDDPYRGLLDAAFREDLEAYADQEVTLLADVAEVVSPRVFAVTSPNGGEVDPVLVVATADAGNVDLQVGQSLVIAATPVRDLEAEAVVEEQALDVEQEQLEEWDGETYLVATILETAA